MAALMLVLMMAIPMGMLAGMQPCLVAVLMAIMCMGHRFVLMSVFVVATHLASPPFGLYFKIL
jgi:hypothetical protein